MPLVYAPAPTAAATAPASISAVVVVGNAEVLSGLVLHQLVTPGAPFVYGAGCDTLDMRTMINPYVSPEWLLGCQAGCDLAHHYGLPSFSYAAYSDAKTLDEQWGVEAGVTAAVGALSRGTLLHDVGYLESGMLTAYEAVVLGDELVGFARHLLRDVGVDDEALAVDEIVAAGPGGNHLGRPYTRRHYREFYVPSLIDKAAHDRWESAGALTLKDRVRARVAELRAAPPLFELDEDVSRRLDAMVAAAGGALSA